MWPSLTLVVRAWHGVFDVLDRVFLPTYSKFWPSRDFWPNSNLVFVWDAESEKDRAAARRLHANWDSVLLASGKGRRRAGRTGNPTRRAADAALNAQWLEDAWFDVFEAPPNSTRHYCDAKKPGKLGYLRQVWSAWNTDLTLLQETGEEGASFLQDLGGEDLKSTEDLFIGYLDADMAFNAPVHPEDLFDFDDRRKLWKPQAMGFNIRCEFSAAPELCFTHSPPISCFMNGAAAPWIFRFRDFAFFREAATQAVFANLHDFFKATSPVRESRDHRDGGEERSLMFPSESENVTRRVGTIWWRAAGCGAEKGRQARTSTPARGASLEDLVAEPVYLRSGPPTASRAFYEQWRHKRGRAGAARNFMSLRPPEAGDEEAFYREKTAGAEGNDHEQACTNRSESLPFAEMYFRTRSSPFTFNDAWGLAYRCFFPWMGHTVSLDRSVAFVTPAFAHLYHSPAHRDLYSWYLRDDSEQKPTYAAMAGRQWVHADTAQLNDHNAAYRGTVAAWVSPDQGRSRSTSAGTTPTSSFIPRDGIGLHTPKADRAAGAALPEPLANAVELASAGWLRREAEILADLRSVWSTGGQQGNTGASNLPEKLLSSLLMLRRSSTSSLTSGAARAHAEDEEPTTHYKMFVVHHAWYLKRLLPRERVAVVDVLTGPLFAECLYTSTGERGSLCSPAAVRQHFEKMLGRHSNFTTRIDQGGEKSGCSSGENSRAPPTSTTSGHAVSVASADTQRLCAEKLWPLWSGGSGSRDPKLEFPFRLVLLLTRFVATNPFFSGVSCDTKTEPGIRFHTCGKVNVRRMLARTLDHYRRVRKAAAGGAWPWWIIDETSTPFRAVVAKRLFCQQHTSTVNMAGGDQHTASAEARKVGAPEDGKHHPSALRNREVIWEKLEPIFGRMSTFSESVRVLEVGCGSGAHAEWFGDKVRELNCKSRTPDFPWPIMRQAGYHFNIFWERTDRVFESIEQVCNPTGVRENREDRMKFRTTVPFVLDLLDPLGAKLRAEDAPYALWNSDPAAKRQVGNKSHQHAGGGQGEGEVAYDEDYFFYDMVYASNLCHISPWEATENLWRVVVPKADADKVILYGPFKKDNAFTMAGPGGK
eukprot:g13928.t1